MEAPNTTRTGSVGSAAAGPGRVTRPEAGTAARGLTAFAVALSASVHLALWSIGYGTGTPIRPAFLANAIGGLALGLVVLLWRHWLPLLAAVGFAGATLGAFILSITVGLFGEDPGTASGTPQLLAASAEVAIVVFAVLTFVSERQVIRLRRQASTT